MNLEAKPRILCVDDESNVLDSFRRLLRKDYDLNIAASGADGLRLMEQNGPFAVVVSDYKMPGMNGVEFLSRAREIAPETVRVMLTGHADETTAAKAINDGRIFRFLFKPIASGEFIQVLEACIEQYRLLFAERELLEKTLKGSIELMTEILSLTNPIAFSRATRVCHYARQMAANLGVTQLWQLEVASMLSHIGYVTIPTETLRKRMAAIPIAPQENQMFEDLPEITLKLIGHIPRLESIVSIIETSLGAKNLGTIPMHDSELVNAAILRAVIHFDEQMEQGLARSEVIANMMTYPARFNQTVLDQLESLKSIGFGKRVRKISIHQIRTGMVLQEEIVTNTGLTVAPKGFRVNDLIRQLLKNLYLQDCIQEYVDVLVEEGEVDEVPLS
jgi:CheY-like chemotaxis protein